MRWSRHQADSSLGELMDSQPDDDTAVRTLPAATPNEPPADAQPPEADPTDDSFLDDEDYLPQERRGPGRLTVALVTVLVLAVGVLGGVWVQKQFGATTSAAGFRAGQGTAGGGTAGGGYGTGQRGYGGTGGTGGTGTGGTGAGAGTSGAGGAGAGQAGTGQGGGAGGDAPAGTGSDTTGGTGTPTTPAVVGTLTSAGKKSLVVTDLGGTKHTVTLSSSTTVTTTYTHGALKAGDTVAVVGTAGSGGSVAATSITVT